MRSSLIVATSLIAAFGAEAAPPEVRLLWPDGAPGAVGAENKDKPKITVYLPEGVKNVSAGVVVCPGGGYGGLAMDHEGKQIAEWLTSRGIAAFVLEYRLGPRYHHPAPMLDVQRALRTVRAGAAGFSIKPDRVGVWGFSAGGHLASTAATHFDSGKPDAADPIDRVSCRPDFAILAYPVVSMELGVTHGGSRRNLLGDHPADDLVTLMSNDKQVTKQTPPTFLFHTAEDKAVLVENSLRFFRACMANGVPAELHVHEKGRHGVGLAQKEGTLSAWPDALHHWLQLRGILPK